MRRDHLIYILGSLNRRIGALELDSEGRGYEEFDRCKKVIVALEEAMKADYDA